MECIVGSDFISALETVIKWILMIFALSVVGCSEEDCRRASSECAAGFIVNQGKKAIKEKASEIRAIKKQEKLESIHPSQRPPRDIGFQTVKGTHHSLMVVSCRLMTIDGPTRMNPSGSTSL